MKKLVIAILFSVMVMQANADDLSSHDWGELNLDGGAYKSMSYLNWVGEIELAVGGGGGVYGVGGGGLGGPGWEFATQFGWKQLYKLPMMWTVDFAIGGANDFFINLDLNTSFYYKRWTFGVGFGHQWYENESEEKYKRWTAETGNYYYIKPNISFNWQFFKLSLESHLFLDKGPDISFIVSLRDWGAIFPVAILMPGLRNMATGQHLNVGVGPDQTTTWE